MCSGLQLVFFFGLSCTPLKQLRVKPTILKVEDDARPDDSMLRLPKATDNALSDASWPLWDYAGLKPVGDKVDENAVPENSMPPLEDEGNKTPAISKQGNPGRLEDPPPLSRGH